MLVPPLGPLPGVLLLEALRSRCCTAGFGQCWCTEQCGSELQAGSKAEGLCGSWLRSEGRDRLPSGRVYYPPYSPCLAGACPCCLGRESFDFCVS